MKIMKKSTTIVILLVLAILKTQAQDYLISFAGAGETTEVSTVKVDNLTSGATLTLNGTDILHLSATVGIATPEKGNGALQVYPNPIKEQSVLTFITPGNGNAVISIVDLSGKTVCKISTLLSTGTYCFRVSGIRQGIYFVKVIGENYSYSAKLISHSTLQSEARIEYVSFDKFTTGNYLKNTAETIDMKYFAGDQLLFTGTSGIYRTIVADVPTSSKTITFNFAGCTDGDGNNYATVQIGSGKSVQTWMAENLNVGVRIDCIQEQTDNGIVEKYCPEDDVNNCNVYGGSYQWNEMMKYVNIPGDVGICPDGWHLPTDEEWSVLTDYLGGEDTAGGNMKETGSAHWQGDNIGATNSSGFTALPAGVREASGVFGSLTANAYFWSSSQQNGLNAWGRDLSYSYGDVSHAYYDKLMGISVRCVK